MNNLFSSFATKRMAPSIFILFLLTVSQACSASTGNTAMPSSSATPEATIQPETTSQPEVTIQQDITFGPGSFNYGDPEVGLADLSSYTATLSLSFDGTRNGKPEKWSRIYTMLATNDPLARQWNIEQTADASAAEVIFKAELDGLDYEEDRNGTCIANVIQPDDRLSDSLELASFLSGVIGAEEAGEEMVNQIATNHYTFDQRALGQDGLNQSTGEMWVATQGSYLVKYLLTTKAGPNYFGDRVDGTLTIDYELTGPNAPIDFSLPDDCPPGLVDAPMLPDAISVVNSPGLQSYYSSASIADAATFYEMQLPPLGWTAQGDPSISDTTAVLLYTKGQQAMVITIEVADQGALVTIFVGQNQGFP